MACTCDDYAPVALSNDAMARRIRESKQIGRGLEEVAQHPNGVDALYRCASCGRLWQRSLAWSFGNKPYFFQVPDIAMDAWMEEPYVRPDLMNGYAGAINLFMSSLDLTVSGVPCRRAGCTRNAVSGLALCLPHHIENLQTAKRLAAPPAGRMFPPYEIATDVPTAPPPPPTADSTPGEVPGLLQSFGRWFSRASAGPDRQ